MNFIRVFLWKRWFRITGKIMMRARDKGRILIGSPNFSWRAVRIHNWALHQNMWAHATLHDLTCKCGYEERKSPRFDEFDD